MRKEKGIETLDAKKLHKGLHWKGKKKSKLLEPDLLKNRLEGFGEL